MHRTKKTRREINGQQGRPSTACLSKGGCRPASQSSAQALLSPLILPCRSCRSWLGIRWPLPLLLPPLLPQLQVYARQGAPLLHPLRHIALHLRAGQGRPSAVVGRQPRQPSRSARQDRPIPSQVAQPASDKKNSCHCSERRGPRYAMEQSASLLASGERLSRVMSLPWGSGAPQTRAQTAGSGPPVSPAGCRASAAAMGGGRRAAGGRQQPGGEMETTVQCWARYGPLPLPVHPSLGLPSQAGSRGGRSSSSSRGARRSARGAQPRGGGPLIPLDPLRIQPLDL